MDEIRGRNAVVTGGGSGIGRGTALALASAGVNVVVADIEAGAAEAVSKELEVRGVRSLPLHVDVTSEASLEEAAEAVERSFGKVHILSNNAGVTLDQGPISQKSSADWEWVFSVNTFGIVKSVQAFLPAIRAHGEGGHIVNTASMAGLVAIAELEVGVYTASKYACVGYSEILRAELEAENIGVSVFCPGMVESNLGATSARNRPKRFGGPLPEPEGEIPDNLRASMMSGEDAGEIVVRGILANRLHILTHPESRAFFEMRFGQLLADCSAQEADRKAKG